jgi:ligand-binding SRPBCC domain-containing protein
MTGFRKETIHRYIRNGDLTVLGDSSKYYVPKSHLIKFAVSPMFFDNKSKSAEFKKLLGGFEIWKAAK